VTLANHGLHRYISLYGLATIRTPDPTTTNPPKKPEKGPEFLKISTRPDLTPPHPTRPHPTQSTRPHPTSPHPTPPPPAGRPDPWKTLSGMGRNRYPLFFKRKVELLKDMKNIVRFVTIVHQTVDQCMKHAPVMGNSNDERINRIPVSPINSLHPSKKDTPTSKTTNQTHFLCPPSYN
jgi:hypothetical protein